MKKILISILTLIFCYGITEAQQNSESVANKRVIWGIKANLGAELPGHIKNKNINEKMYNSGFSGSIGGLANIALGKNFYFEPEVALFYDQYSYDKVEALTDHSPSVNIGPSIHKFGFRIPLNFGYFINISEKWGLDVFTGPELSYAFSGTARYDKSDAGLVEDVIASGLGEVFSGPFEQNRFNVDWKVGIGFPVDHFLISLEGDFGLTNMMKKTWTMHENRVTLGIGYYF